MTIPPLMPWRPLNEDFDQTVIEMSERFAPQGFNVSDRAPQTYDALVAEINKGGPIPLWSGASGATIYGSPQVNYAFRAWHDATHFRLRQPFTFVGEAAVAKHQVRQMRTHYHNHPQLKEFSALLFSEVVGQKMYAELHGDFPPNQRLFTKKFVSAILEEQPPLPAPKSEGL